MSTGKRSTVDAVLAGTGRYDDLTEDEQALVREAWRQRIDERIASLDLVAEAKAEGRGWVEADVDGRPVLRNRDAPGA